MACRVRFAPSPTGYLHVGNVRTALINWLFARKAGGEFLLRLDDTDAERSKLEFETAIREDMLWLGLQWNHEARQTDRLESYKKAAEKLKTSGRLYACYETSEELEFKRKIAAGRGKPPVYDRAALNMGEEEKKKFEAQGRKPHWRFLLEAKDIVWNDMVRGETKFHGSNLSDPVLLREDGIPVYTLASVVDDGELEITHILRGEDHVSNTAVQVQLFEALGFAPPEFGHLALIRAKEGELSKRTGGGDIRGLRARGIEPMAVNSLLARLGTSDSVEAFTDIQDLVKQFDITRFGRSPALYDEAELDRLNAKIISHQPFASVKDKLPAGVNESLWLAVRGNISSLAQAEEWVALVAQKVTPKIEDAEFTRQAASLLPEGEWNENTWNEWVGKVKEATGRKGKELFHPLRLALTAREDGPELKTLLPLIGREKALKRLKGEAA